jgi:hypothetical protein
MGTRINALFAHNLSGYRDHEITTSQLAASLPAALAVDDYWRINDPHYLPHPLTEWRADPVSAAEPDLQRYTAPGSLYLTVTQHAAKIRTGGRWAGFMSIASLRAVHLNALKAIAKSLGADTLALFPDSCELNDFFWANRTYWDCILLLEQMWGPPQGSIEDIDLRTNIFRVWFLDVA